MKLASGGDTDYGLINKTEGKWTLLDDLEQNLAVARASSGWPLKNGHGPEGPAIQRQILSTAACMLLPYSAGNITLPMKLKLLVVSL